ncbi:MAG TPA: hypothetical protein VKT18_01765, partial [Acidimicrobiales bacterium]|nr:hypothetical protein [Acidimicrobiales bacterium]
MVPFVWSEDCLLHAPDAEVWVGVRMPATEVAERALRIRESLRAAGAEDIPATPHADDRLFEVHDAALLSYLRTAWDTWSAAGLPSNRVVPYVFAHEGLARAPV